PLGIAGLILMYRKTWRIALLLTLWLLPGTLLYMTYYWGNNAPGVAYLRFFLTLFPPLIIAALWLLREAGGERGSIVAPLTAGILVAATAAVGLMASLPELERQQRGNLNLHFSDQQILAKINPMRDKPPVVFADQGLFPQLLQYMQFMCDGNWYPTDVFELRAMGGFGVLGLAQKMDPSGQNGPVVLQRERVDYMEGVLKGKTAADLIRLQHSVMDDALSQSRPIYAILTSIQAPEFRKHFISSDYEMTELTHWSEPCSINFPATNRANGMYEESPLAPPSWSGEPFIRWYPQSLTLFKITRAKTH
ncbi:MAG TPA: hypothetical protein VKK61_04450, partial [Tepidisphaeraceae bacterium]|nr:hypothetical protein [Tepidisphaeraceae bacterium]